MMFTQFMQRSLQSLHQLGYRLMPGSCILCQLPSQQARDLCQACEQQLPRLQQACDTCALPLELASTQSTLRCGRCLKQKNHFDRTVAAFHYAAPIDKLINQFKFQQKLAAGQVLAQLLAEKIQHTYDQQELPSLIIPVPLHRKRLWQRGFNQANEIAKVVSHQCQLPLQRFVAQRIRNTQPQTSLTALERRKNCRGAFVCQTLTAKHVAVIDDVMTTTTTVNEFCRILKAAGANRVDVWCVARTYQGRKH